MKDIEFEKVTLMICKILRLFVNKFAADDKYSLLNRDNLTQPIQIQLSQKQKTFSRFFSAVFKSRLNFEHFQTNMTLIANVFPKLRNPKYVVRYTFQSLASQYPSRSNMVKAPKYSSDLHGSTFTIFIAKDIEFEKVTLSDMQNLKTINKLTVNDNYSLLNRDNLTQPIQIQLSQKQKAFSQFFF